jgi:hypothetical protein
LVFVPQHGCARRYSDAGIPELAPKSGGSN